MAEVDRVFTAADRAAIAAAVHAAERGTSGEIVPLVVGTSDGYEGAAWKGATLGSLLAVAGIAFSVGLWPGSWCLSPWAALGPALGALVGFALGRWCSVARRWLTGATLLAREVRQRSREAFLEQEVFRTRERTGILLFVSLFERRVEILADEGIHAAVGHDEWQAIADDLADGLRRRAGTPALVEAIRRCGELLRVRRVLSQGDDANEISDELRLSDR